VESYRGLRRVRGIACDKWTLTGVTSHVAQSPSAAGRAQPQQQTGGDSATVSFSLPYRLDVFFAAGNWSGRSPNPHQVRDQSPLLAQPAPGVRTQSPRLFSVFVAQQPAPHQAAVYDSTVTISLLNLPPTCLPPSLPTRGPLWCVWSTTA
jgi:hypothetical protein